MTKPTEKILTDMRKRYQAAMRQGDTLKAKQIHRSMSSVRRARRRWAEALGCAQKSAESAKDATRCAPRAAFALERCNTRARVYARRGARIALREHDHDAMPAVLSAAEGAGISDEPLFAEVRKALEIHRPEAGS